MENLEIKGAKETFENQLRAFARDAEHPAVEQIFVQHADETASQKQRLTARLEALGGKPSGLKGFLGSVFGVAPTAAQMGHEGGAGHARPDGRLRRRAQRDRDV